jgi:hypothetical protein
VLLAIGSLSATALCPTNEKAPILWIAALGGSSFQPESLAAFLNPSDAHGTIRQSRY